MNLFDVFKEFRRGGAILSADFNDLQSALVGSFKKLGTERDDSETGVEGTFSVGEPIKPVNATTKGYVDAKILTVTAKDGARGPKGPQGEQGLPFKITGSVPTYADLAAIDAEQSDVYVADDSNIMWLYDAGKWVDLGQVKGQKGDKGSKGDAGKNGSNGATGPKGDPGKNGTNGSAGSTGLQGPRGYRGYTGEAGEDYSGPNIERGADQEMLYWANNGWKATGVIRLTGYGVTIPYMGKSAPSFVVANELGLLNSVVVPTSFSDMDKTFGDLEAKVLDLTSRLAKLEKNI